MTTNENIDEASRENDSNATSLDIERFIEQARIERGPDYSGPSDYELVQNVVIASNNCFWQPTDFPTLNPERVGKALSKLVGEREIVRIIRGLYWRGEKDELDNVVLPTTYQIVSQILGIESGIGYTGLTAIRKLHLQPEEDFVKKVRDSELEDKVFIAIPRRVPRNVPGAVLVNRMGASKRIDADLNWLEVSYLEVLHNWHDIKENKFNKDRLKELASLYSSRPEPETETVIRINRVCQAAETEKAIVRDSLINVLLATEQEELANQIMPPRSRHSHPGIAIT